MSSDAARQARSREVRYLMQELGGRRWQPSCLATALDKLGYLEELMGTREGCRWYGEELRTLLGHVEGVHWGVNLGLYLYLVEKVSTHTLRRFRQASSEKYCAETDTYVRKVLWENPYDENDTVPFPYPMPAPCAFREEVAQLGESHGLVSVCEGLAAHQQVRVLCYPMQITRMHALLVLITYTGVAARASHHHARCGAAASAIGILRPTARARLPAGAAGRCGTERQQALLAVGVQERLHRVAGKVHAITCTTTAATTATTTKYYY